MAIQKLIFCQTYPNMPIAYMHMHDNSDGHNQEDRIVPPHAYHQPGRPRVRRIKSGVEGPFIVKKANVRAVMDWVMLCCDHL